MRIISGKYGGRTLHPPKGLPVRPTTDQAKEALFNILSHRFDFDDLNVLDLFSGTGNIGYEFLSRGVQSVNMVDRHNGCAKYIRDVLKQLGAADGRITKSDVKAFLKRCNTTFDLIFLDPPYQMPGQSELIDLIIGNSLLNPGGLIILEHEKKYKVPHSTLQETRCYGNSCFSFYEIS